MIFFVKCTLNEIIRNIKDLKNLASETRKVTTETELELKSTWFIIYRVADGQRTCAELSRSLRIFKQHNRASNKHGQKSCFTTVTMTCKRAIKDKIKELDGIGKKAAEGAILKQYSMIFLNKV